MQLTSDRSLQDVPQPPSDFEDLYIDNGHFSRVNSAILEAATRNAIALYEQSKDNDELIADIDRARAAFDDRAKLHDDIHRVIYISHESHEVIAEFLSSCEMILANTKDVLKDDQGERPEELRVPKDKTDQDGKTEDEWVVGFERGNSKA